MSRNIFVCNKDEAYSFDELLYIQEGIEDLEQKNKIQSLLNAIGEEKNKKALFFMPAQTFNIFALVQGGNSICEITSADIEKIIKELTLSQSTFVGENQKFSDFIVEKLTVLLDFMTAGNNVKPVCIQADNFSEIEIV